jgi:MoxR-like ATPase
MSKTEVTARIGGVGVDMAASSPLARLQALREKYDVVQNDHGIGFIDGPGQNKSIVFSAVKGEQVVTVPTTLDQSGFDRLMAKTIALDETRAMLFELAKAYEQRMPIMLEGGTAIGKTFAVNLFAKLLYGEKAVTPDFYCNGQTDVSELMGKYVPAGVKPEDQQRITQFLSTEAGAALKAELIKETSGNYKIEELYQRAAVQLGFSIDAKAFEFQLGVLPKAMTAGHDAEGVLQYRPDGPGVLLHVQEVGLAAPAVVNALLGIRGEQGRIADSIQVWQDGGRKIDAGPGFFVVFSTNPPGKGFQERFAVDKALARGLIWINLPEKLSDESLHKAAKAVFSFDKVPQGKDAVIDLSQERDLGEVLGVVMARFHKMYGDMIGGGEPGRQQKVPATLDSLWRVAALMQDVQILNDQRTGIDMVATLREAVRGIYINCLEGKPPIAPGAELKNDSAETIGGKIMEAFEESLNNSNVTSVTVRGEKMSAKQALEMLTREALMRGVDGNVASKPASGPDMEEVARGVRAQDALNRELQRMGIGALGLIADRVKAMLGGAGSSPQNS